MIRVNSQSFSLSSTLNKKPNEDRVDSSQLESPNWIKTLPPPSQQQKKSSIPSLRLHYVTERILAYILPTRNGHFDEEQNQYEKEVIPMLEQKHGQNYKLFNLETCISVITLERICELCKHIDKWLGSGQEKVVVLQDSEDCQRLGATIIAFLEYLRICASNYQTRHINQNEDTHVQNTIARNWMNLDMFSMKKFLEGNIEPLHIPSFKRYIRYFSGLLSGQIKLNASPLHLNYISIESPPSFMLYKGVSSKSEWSSFIKIYEGLQCVYTSDVHIIPITTRQFLYQIGNLRLRGDILVRCYQTGFGNDRSTKRLVFSIQFHTCAIKNDEVVFVKEDLDYAHDEPQFPNDCKVSFHFNSASNNNYLFQSPLIRTERLNDIDRANSIENLDLNSCHTQGPLDGSLYATILKSPKSSHSPNNINDQSIKSIASFDKSFEAIKTSTPIKIASRSEAGRTSFREASAPLPNRSEYNSQIENRPGTSQSNYRHHSTVSHHQTNSATVVQNPDNRTCQNGSREFVRSPLTLSMDSGISSSGGVINRPTIATSVSPSSFPSQVSPQDDRHRELDDILSDMLSTVQDIPDFQNRKSSTHSINHNRIEYDRSQSVVSHTSGTTNASSPVYTLPIQNSTALNNNRDLVHNSRSFVLQENVHRHSCSNSYNKQDRFDPYDTASTTTTLTPPPSESGRDTPNLFSGYHSSTSNISRQQQQQQHPQQQRRNGDTNTAIPTIMPSQHSQIVSPSQSYLGQAKTQHQSATYHRAVRTASRENNPITSEDEDNIPYHAREHSQPFTYGNVPANSIHLNDTSVSVVSGAANQEKDPRMIKAQSGLTSPMLVRKTFSSGISDESPSYSTLRKPDFEEMLRERRAKVMSEKYLISDKTPGTSNGYHNYYNEPLKRSNTLDGFHRSTSTNELSGQTWLQLQQQKLRAKKNAQLKDERKFFEEIHTEIKNRPLRSRNIARYDGYASDTAAFDEVDYRRPLHVQTPHHTSNSSPERHYHTISTTTKTVTKERPFVAVKRSHETVKQEKLGSPSLSPLAIINASPLGHIAQAQPSNYIRNSNSNINNISSNKNQNGLLSLAESPISNERAKLVREESFSSFRSETDQDISIAGSPRPETPAFPVTPRTPYGLHNGSSSPGIPPRSPTPQRKDIYGGAKGHFHELSNQNDTIYRARMNSNASNANSEPQEVAPHLVKFARDSSKFWYKPNLSREEAINLLRNATPGTFIVRDSTTFKNAYGLVVRVAQPPPGVAASPGSDELVRHFLVEPTTRGVRLKGCTNEPVFSTLSALVYQHSITQLALPCRLIIPDSDIQPEREYAAQKQQLAQGAACNVLYLHLCGTESLTGEEAIRRAVSQLFSTSPLPKPIEVHIKVSPQGITLTDNTRKHFFRKHYAAHNISFCGTDPDHRQWSIKTDEGVVPVSNKTIFAFVARRSSSSKDNQCHVFCDLAVTQPASAIVSFANKVLPVEQQPNRII